MDSEPAGRGYPDPAAEHGTTQAAAQGKRKHVDTEPGRW